MELLQLQYFFDSARTENFAKTAEKHFVPPSSVSASVKRLESELGCKLFDRQSNKITLNENGKKLQRSLGIIFDELDHIKSELIFSKSETTEIKILVKTIRSYITEAIIDYRKNHHNLRFETSFDMGESDHSCYDIIIDEQNDIYTGLQKFEIYSTRLRIKAAVDNPFCGRTLTMAQLRNQPFITMGKDSNMHKILLRTCKNAGFVPNIVMETNDIHCYGRCISSGMGIGLTREKLTLPPAKTNTAYLLVTDFEERQTFYGYYDPKKINSHIQDFVDYLKCRNI